MRGGRVRATSHLISIRVLPLGPQTNLGGLQYFFHGLRCCCNLVLRCTSFVHWPTRPSTTREGWNCRPRGREGGRWVYENIKSVGCKDCASSGAFVLSPRFLPPSCTEGKFTDLMVSFIISYTFGRVRKVSHFSRSLPPPPPPPSFERLMDVDSVVRHAG